MTHILRRALVAAPIAWAALLPVAPFAVSRAAPASFWYGLAFVVYAAGSFVCHQLPARSFHLWAAQMPVCARCTGIYFGAAATVVTYVVSGFSRTAKPHHARVLLAAAALPTLITLVYEWTTGDVPSNAIRALAGAPLGAAIIFIVIGALQRPSAARPLVQSGRRTL